MKNIVWILAFVLFGIACQPTETKQAAENTSESSTSPTSTDTLRYENEKYIKNLKQLTFGGDNAEAYFSFDNQNLVFQAHHSARSIGVW